MTQSIFDHLSDVASMVRAAPHVFLFLDYDGTLAPIVDEPEAASMPRETARALAALERRARFSIAIVSGRSLSDVRERVGLEGLIYAGDHGFAIRGPGLSFTDTVAVERMGVLQELARDLQLRLCDIAGIRIENKGLTASVHYRKAREADLAEIRRIVNETVTSAGDLYRVSQGLSVLEIRPRVNWNKGAAVQWILASTGNRDSLSIYLGDDTTDEDAFEVLQSGVTVRIGQTDETSARYHIEYQESVEQFLTWLTNLDGRLPAPAFQRSDFMQGERK